MFEGKKLILLSTAPGKRGGRTVLNAAINRFPKHGGEIIGTMTLPNFKENFNPETGFKNDQIRDLFESFMNEINRGLKKL